MGLVEIGTVLNHIPIAYLSPMLSKPGFDFTEAKAQVFEGSRHFHRPKTSCLIFHVERCPLRALT